MIPTVADCAHLALGWGYPMVSELRDRINAYLLEHKACVVSTGGSFGAWAMPSWYRPVATALRGGVLDLECLLPRWADVVYHLEQDPRVLVIILDARAVGLRWLQYLGTARPIGSPDWERLLPREAPRVRPEERYVAIRITPQRIDVIDEGLGWGARETLDL